MADKTYIGDTKIESTGVQAVDDAIKAQAQANAQAIALSTTVNSTLTTMNAEVQATRKIQPS